MFVARRSSGVRECSLGRGERMGRRFGLSMACRSCAPSRLLLAQRLYGTRWCLMWLRPWWARFALVGAHLCVAHLHTSSSSFRQTGTGRCNGGPRTPIVAATTGRKIRVSRWRKRLRSWRRGHLLRWCSWDTGRDLCRRWLPGARVGRGAGGSAEG